MRGIGAAAAGGGSGSLLSLAACRPERTGCSTATARGPAPGDGLGDRCERLSTSGEKAASRMAVSPANPRRGW